MLNNHNIPNNHRLFFDLFSDRLAAGTYRSNGMTVGDWRNNPDRVDDIFENLQQALNSNEDFEMNDSFHMEVITVAPAIRQVRGRRHRCKKVTYQGIDDFLLKNKSVIMIRNQQDNLCAARAIITSKATVDYPANHPFLDVDWLKKKKLPATNIKKKLRKPSIKSLKFPWMWPWVPTS